MIAGEHERGFEPHAEVGVLGAGLDDRAARSDAERGDPAQRLPPGPGIRIIERVDEDRAEVLAVGP